MYCNNHCDMFCFTEQLVLVKVVLGCPFLPLSEHFPILAIPVLKFRLGTSIYYYSIRNYYNFFPTSAT